MQALTDRVIVPTTLAAVTDTQLYFQQLRKPNECTAEDGRLVGHQLMDLIDRKPRDVAKAIRAFALHSAMLRDSGFRNIGFLLVALARDHHGPQNGSVTLSQSDPGPHASEDGPIASDDAGTVTPEQAARLGKLLASPKALGKVVRSCAVLRAMKARCDWFVPMIVAIAERKRAGSHARLKVDEGSLMVPPDVADAMPAPQGDEDSWTDLRARPLPPANESAVDLARITKDGASRMQQAKDRWREQREMVAKSSSLAAEAVASQLTSSMFEPTPSPAECSASVHEFSYASSVGPSGAHSGLETASEPAGTGSQMPTDITGKTDSQRDLGR
jgi:hypothetical protein